MGSAVFSPADFGLLNYAILFPTIFTSFAGLGLNSILMVEYVKVNENDIAKHQLLSTGLIIRVITGCTAYILIVIINFFWNKNEWTLFILINITALSLLWQSAEVIDTYFQSQTKAKVSVIVKLITFSLAICARIYVLIAHLSIIYLAIINAIESILAYGLILGVYQRYSGQLIKSIIKAVDKQLIRGLIIMGWPIMLTEFFVYIYMKIDQFMIESLSTNQELGLYSAAIRISESWYFVAIAICSSLYPKIAELWTVNKVKFYERYQSMLNVLTYVSIFLSIFFSIFADLLIKELYGEQYNGAGNVLRIHIWAGIFVFTGVGVNNLLIIKNLQRFVLVKTIAAAVLNIILNFWLIPKYGAVGASIATLISYFLSAYGMNLLYPAARDIFLLQTKSFVNFLTFKKPITGENLISLKQQVI